MATYNNSQIRNRIDTQANWQTNNPTLASGEIALTSDSNVMDFKVGNGSAWTNTSYFIRNNNEVKAIKTTANNAATTANTANSNSTIAMSNASIAVGRIRVHLMEDYEVTSSFLTENLTDPYNSVSKKAVFGEWCKFALDKSQPAHRLTDAVTWDTLFVFLRALADQGIISINSMTDFGTAFDTYMTNIVGSAARTKQRMDEENLRADMIRS